MKRLTKKDIQDIYGVKSRTIAKWIKYFGLPMYAVSPRMFYITEDDLLEWERKIRSSSSLQGIIS